MDVEILEDLFDSRETGLPRRVIDDPPRNGVVRKRIASFLQE